MSERERKDPKVGATRGGRKAKTAPEFTPLADAKAAILAFGATHPALVCAGSFVAVMAMGVLLVWFTYFSGYNAPTQFIYAGF